MLGDKFSDRLKTKVCTLLECVAACICLHYLPRWIVRAVLSLSMTFEPLQYYIYGLDDRGWLSPLFSIGMSVTAWIFIAVWCGARKKDIRQTVCVGRQSASGVFLSAALGFGASQLVMVFCLLFSDSWQELYTNSMRYILNDHRSVLALIIELIAYVVAAPITEEIIFRDVIYGKLCKEFSVLTSVCITSIFFAFIHNSNIQIVYAFLMGIILCIIREWYGSVVTTMIFHMVFNLFGSGLVFSGLTSGRAYFGCAVFVASGFLMIVDMKKKSGSKG